MRGLRGQQLAYGERKLLVECLFVGGFGFIFRFFGGNEKGVVSSAEFCLQIGPDAVYCSARSAAFVNIMNPFLVEYSFEFASKFGSAQRLRQKVALERFIFQVVSDFLESFLAVGECLNYHEQC